MVHLGKIGVCGWGLAGNAGAQWTSEKMTNWAQSFKRSYRVCVSGLQIDCYSRHFGWISWGSNGMHFLQCPIYTVLGAVGLVFIFCVITYQLEQIPHFCYVNLTVINLVLFWQRFHFWIFFPRHLNDTMYPGEPEMFITWKDSCLSNSSIWMVLVCMFTQEIP